jgi:hypothetical protein
LNSNSLRRKHRYADVRRALVVGEKGGGEEATLKERVAVSCFRMSQLRGRDPQTRLVIEHSLGFARFVPSWRRLAVPRSIIQAVREGDWDFEPTTQEPVQLKATVALPGTDAKLDVLAERLRLGLPLWHPRDRLTYGEEEE